MTDAGTFSITRAPPATFTGLLDAAYAGAVHQLPPTPTSLWLVEQARQVLIEALGPEPREAQHRISNEELFDRLSPVRRALYCEPAFHAPLAALVAELGGDPSAVAFDPLRLRVVRSRGHAEVPAARAVYYPHRDTWYAHPSSVVTWWVPLDDLTEDETFVFYPERFATPVPNDSEIFDYDEWVRDGWELKIGWQRKTSGLETRYPGTVGEVDGGPSLGFSCRRGENLLFAGAQFHRTLPQNTGRTRFSLDFRLVHFADAAAGRGAPNVDGRCRGNALRDYVRIGS